MSLSPAKFACAVLGRQNFAKRSRTSPESWLLSMPKNARLRQACRAVDPVEHSVDGICTHLSDAARLRPKPEALFGVRDDRTLRSLHGAV